MNQPTSNIRIELYLTRMSQMPQGRCQPLAAKTLQAALTRV